MTDGINHNKFRSDPLSLLWQKINCIAKVNHHPCLSLSLLFFILFFFIQEKGTKYFKIENKLIYGEPQSKLLSFSSS